MMSFLPESKIIDNGSENKQVELHERPVHSAGNDIRTKKPKLWVVSTNLQVKC